MSELTKAEAAWVRKVQKLLNECPSDRIGGYTIGDHDIQLYDRTLETAICDSCDSTGSDFCTAVEKLDAALGELTFPFNVHSTAG